MCINLILIIQMGIIQYTTKLVITQDSTGMDSGDISGFGCII